jgi:3-phenylpropionate/cinnamic acid dioxygenase small subunit
VSDVDMSRHEFGGVELAAVDVRWAVDQMALRNLVSRIAHTADAGELSAYGECFAPDAEWWPPEEPGVDVPTDPSIGLEHIVSRAADRRAQGVQGPGTHTRHVVSTSAFEMDGPDQARGLSYWRYYTHTAETPRLFSQGEYHDTFVRLEGRWVLLKRVLLRG